MTKLTKLTKAHGEHMAATRDPSPAEIEQMTAEIRAGWTPAEKLKRLRVDLRPHYTRCDGVEEDIDAEDYDEHHEQHEALEIEQ